MLIKVQQITEAARRAQNIHRPQTGTNKRRDEGEGEKEEWWVEHL